MYMGCTKNVHYGRIAPDLTSPFTYSTSLAFFFTSAWLMPQEGAAFFA